MSINFHFLHTLLQKCNICSLLGLCSFFQKKFETFYFLIQSYLFQNVTELSSNPCRLWSGYTTQQRIRKAIKQKSPQTRAPTKPGNEIRWTDSY
jgi:uncharacterized membrane protein